MDQDDRRNEPTAGSPARPAGDSVTAGSAGPKAFLREPRPVTRMRDIALAAGVSHSTVSRVLNNAPTRVPIAEETRARVIAAAKQLRYRPNPMARALRGSPTMLIGAVVRDFSDPFFAAALEAFATAASDEGYNIVLGHAHSRLDAEVALSSVLEIRHCDAVVMLGDMQDQPRLLEDLRDSTVPVVALWQGTSPLEFPTVDVDDRSGIHAALDHLVRLGHRRIGFISGRLPSDNPHREDAFVEYAARDLGGTPPGYVQRVPNSLSGGEDGLRAMLDLPEPPTAVVTSTDLVAVGVLHAAYSLDRSVPADLSVVGFDDLLLAAHTVPPLTTLHMPVGEIVGEGVRLAIDLSRDASASREPRVTYHKATLVVRQSTAPPRGGVGA